MSWQVELREGLRSAADLRASGLIDERDVPAYEQVLKKYKFFLPRYYAGLIDRNDPRCPIRRQAIPSPQELADTWGSADPLFDADHRAAPRLTHRYRNRVLLHLTPNCSMYCRYCFRKSLLNELQDTLFGGELEHALHYLATRPEIEEVIFSGGDPLLANEALLAEVLSRLAALPHLERVRFHTRVPVTLPARITADWVALVTATRLPVVLVTHFNHPREVTRESAAAVALLKAGGLTLLNQSVLLAGVNDDAGVLTELSKRLFALGILPYYLHHPDPARGTGHFDLPTECGLAIHRELRARLAGYLVPRYVRDDGNRLFKADVSATGSTAVKP